jgi:hypothetical protein
MNIAEKWNAYKAWKKAKIEELHEKHPKVADALVKTQAVVAVGLIFGATYAAGYSDGHKAFERKLTDVADEIKKERVPEESGTEPTVSYDSFNKEFNDPWSRGWKEEYRENYNKVCDFANTLDLVRGEEFVISDTKQFENEPWFKGDATKPVISHMIDGDGCYPPEDE